MVFEYAGDDGSRIVSWFNERLGAIRTCINEALPGAALTLVYCGIDTFGLLNAGPGVQDATGDTFKEWREKYVLPHLQSVEGDPVTADDLWSARCGFLHTSTPLSKLTREGKAHEVWYQFSGRAGMNLILNTKLRPLGLEVENLAIAFETGGHAFLADLGQNEPCLKNADARAQHFLRWGKVVT